MAEKNKTGVLMVCLGNICRSPIAEAVFLDEVKKRGLTDKWFVDSAGTCGYHVGKSPEMRARTTLEKHNVPYDHKARVICPEDYHKFHFIFGMDHENVKDIKDDQPSDSKAVVKMFGDYDPVDKGIIHDPYYDRGSEGFEVCYQRCVRSVKAFLDKH